MAVNAYVNFKGNCREAVDFYADVFHAEKQPITTYGQMEHGFPMPDSTKNLIMHTTLNISGSTVMFADVPEGMPYTVGNNISLVITGSDISELEAIFNRLKDGGRVTMELQETFWSKRYGFVIDRYGVGWQISHEEPAAR